MIEAREFVGDICGSKVMQGVSIRATNDERSTSTRYTDSATYQIGKTITVMANCERNGGSGAITVTININGQVKTAEVMPYTAGIPAMYQTVVFSVYTTSPVVDIRALKTLDLTAVPDEATFIAIRWPALPQ